MTNTDTADVASITGQVAELRWAGSERVRVPVNTAQLRPTVSRTADKLAMMNVEVPVIRDFHHNGYRSWPPSWPVPKCWPSTTSTSAVLIASDEPTAAVKRSIAVSDKHQRRVLDSGAGCAVDALILRKPKQPVLVHPDQAKTTDVFSASRIN